MKRKLGVLGGVLAGSLLLSGQGNAADLTTVSRSFSGNDCSGYFGSGFGACNIFVDNNGVEVELSPVIAKYGYDEDSETEYNTGLFPSISGDEFTVTLNAGDTGGSWDYERGVGDPGVRYWAAKAGPNFNLFWTVDASTMEAGGACTGDLYNFDCLSAAVLVSSGTFVNPDGNNLSHITFYDTGEVPLPAAVWLFGSGLVALAGIKRRRKSA